MWGLLAATGVSLCVHAGLGASAKPRRLWVEPAMPSCRVGDRIQLSAQARSLWGHIRLRAQDLEVSLKGKPGGVVPQAGAQLRCERPGVQPVHLRWQHLEAELRVQVHPALRPIELPSAPAGSTSGSAPGPVPAPAPVPAPPPAQVRASRRGRERAAPARVAAPRLPAPGPRASAAPGPAATDTKEDGAGAGLGSGPEGEGPGEGFGAPGGGQGTNAARFVTSPSLRTADPCAGHFPEGAEVNAGSVTVDVLVEADGRVSQTQVLAERPGGQGFAEAARTCLLRTQLEPGRQDGHTPVRSRVRMKIAFVR